MEQHKEIRIRKIETFTVGWCDICDEPTMAIRVHNKLDEYTKFASYSLYACIDCERANTSEGTVIIPQNSFWNKLKLFKSLTDITPRKLHGNS